MKERVVKTAVLLAACFVLAVVLCHICGCAELSAGINENDPAAITTAVDSVAAPLGQVADVTVPGSGLLVKGGAAAVTAFLVFFAGRKAHKAFKASRGTE